MLHPQRRSLLMVCSVRANVAVLGVVQQTHNGFLSLQAYKFGHFFSPLMTESDFEAKPSVLLLGQYSTGKTTFIKFLLGREDGYPGKFSAVWDLRMPQRPYWVPCDTRMSTRIILQMGFQWKYCTRYPTRYWSNRELYLTGINIGPEPTTDRFVVVESGLEERRTPGNTLVVQPSKPYQASELACSSRLICWRRRVA